MKKYTQVERILQIVSWMAMGEKLSAGMVEKRFGYTVSKRDCQRDFLHVFDSGLTITFETIGREKIWYFDEELYRKKIAKMFLGRDSQNVI